MGEVEEVVKLLWKEARQCSEILRETAKARSLRQPGNSERRTDLYAWPKPENTISGEAATMLTTLQARNEQLEAQLAEANQLIRAIEGENTIVRAELAAAWATRRRGFKKYPAPAVTLDEAPGCEHQTGPIGDAT